MSRTIFIASDHAGFDLKAEITACLISAGHNVRDLGTHSKESCDYPVYANELCAEVLATENSVGILICGSGIGMSIAANRHKGIIMVKVLLHNFYSIARATGKKYLVNNLFFNAKLTN